MNLGPLVDTHAHLDSPRMGRPLLDVLDRARNAGVTDVILPAVCPAEFPDARATAATSHAVRIHPAWGLHPQWLPDADPAGDTDALSAVARWCERHPPVAIGECGLDYRVDLERAPRDRQRAVLRGHLQLARELGLPVLLHCLSAFDDLLAEIDVVGGLPAGGILHSYSGSAEQLVPFLRRGLHVSFAGPVSWPGARKAPRAAAACPVDRLLCETDSPDQAPEPHRHSPNEPAHVVHVVEALARARGESPADVAAACTRNARALLRLP